MDCTCKSSYHKEPLDPKLPEGKTGL